MRLTRWLAGFLFLSALIPMPAAAQTRAAHQFVVPGMPGNGFSLSIGSLLDRRFYTVVRQRYDFSCGSAALATLLHYHYGVRANEDTVFAGMWDVGDQALIKQRGFSLLDMKRYLEAQGLASDGYRVTLDQIAKTGVPGIALVLTKGYRHFVVVKGVTKNEVLIGDPSRGLLALPRTDFDKMWDGLFFVITSAQGVGKQSFNRQSQWSSLGRAPVGTVFTHPVDLQALRLATLAYGEF